MRKLRMERARFREEKHELIQKAVEKRKRALESQITAWKHKAEQIEEEARRKIEALKLREAQIEKRAQEKLKKTLALAHSQARKQEVARFKLLEKRLRDSFKNQIRRERRRVKEQLKKAKESGVLQERKRYEQLERSFRSTLTQMKTMQRELHERDVRIRELEKQLERQTTPQIEGLLYEEELAKELKKHFPEDDIKHTGKGGDVLQNVMWRQERAGLIVYECKRVKHYSTKHVRQAAEAKKKRGADFAVLVTSAMKKGTQGFFMEKGVIVTHPAGVLSVASILRGQIVQIARMKLGRLQRDEAIRRTLEYLEGPEFSNSIDSIIQESISVYEKLKDEIKKHMIMWKERYAAYQKIYQEATTVKRVSKDLLSGEKPKAQTAALPVPAELPKTEEPIKITTSTRKKPLGVAVVATGDESVEEL
jgi:hypothetical protein